jgi:hypothetical protein
VGEPNHTTPRKASPSINHSVISGGEKGGKYCRPKKKKKKGEERSKKKKTEKEEKASKRKNT